MSTLRSRAVNAAAWGFVGTAGRIGLQLLAQIVLARLLGPEQYGLFAIGTIIVGLGTFLSDVGIAYALIQKPDVTSIDIRFVSTWQLIIGGTVTFCIVAGAEAIARFFGDLRTVDVIQGLAWICLVNSLAAPSMNLLKRSLDFKWLQTAQIVSYFVGFVLIGIPLAHLGLGVRALVIAWLTQSIIFGVLMYAKVRHPVKPIIWHSEAAGHFRYGVTVLSTNIVNWATVNIDKVLVGRYFSSYQVGLYSTMYNLLYSPAAALLGIFQPVFFSASSRVGTADGDSRRKVTDGYSALICAASVTVLPLFCFVAAVPESVVGALYGPAWSSAASLLTPLALSMPVIFLWGLTTPLLWTSGSPGMEFTYQLPMGVAFALICYVAAQYSTLAVAWSVFGLVMVRATVVGWVACTKLGVGRWQLLGALRGGIIISAAMALVASGIQRVCASMPAAMTLVLSAVVAAMVWLAMLRWMWDYTINAELQKTIMGVAGKIPGVWRERLKPLLRG